VEPVPEALPLDVPLVEPLDVPVVEPLDDPLADPLDDPLFEPLDEPLEEPALPDALPVEDAPTPDDPLPDAGPAFTPDDPLPDAGPALTPDDPLFAPVSVSDAPFEVSGLLPHPASTNTAPMTPQGPPRLFTIRMCPKATSPRSQCVSALGISFCGRARRARGIHISSVVRAVALLPVLTMATTLLFAAPKVEPLAHEWQQVGGTHWQVVASDPGEDPAATDAAEHTRGACPEGMVEVRGSMIVDPGGDVDAVDGQQKSVCTDWINRNFPERCARFDEARWKALAAAAPRKAMHFCIDRFEYPNRRGAFPWIMVSWTDAQSICSEEEKRLCAESEWTFACEGEDALPYPYGFARDADACNVDRTWRAYDPSALGSANPDKTRAEVDRLWQGEASGSRPACRSPFGVYDMTGNVDEWTKSVAPTGHRSILKGGYWGPVRTRCRPTTRVHGESFAFYQQGFRCCADAPAP
jgi:sulfatase modifying factor 1